MAKSPDAFRTISEVAEYLETPAHVLRFWESRFPQIKPVKRAGGRRYYRPADVALLTGIKRLLHDEGMTIRGVQKILREQGVRFVSGMTDDPGVEDDTALQLALGNGMDADDDAQSSMPPAPAAVETAQVIALQTALEDRGRTEGRDRTPDLFARLDDIAPMPADDGANSQSVEARPDAAPPVTDAPAEVEEAPMALWVEETDPPAPTLSELKVTRIGHSAALHAGSPATPVTASQSPSATLASRLRVLDGATLDAADRAMISLIRARARSLRDRLAAPARHGF